MIILEILDVENGEQYGKQRKANNLEKAEIYNL
jgi:hypothetical protein